MTNRTTCAIIKDAKNIGCFYLPRHSTSPEQPVFLANMLANRWGTMLLRSSMAREKISGVYEIVNKVNGHRYIGSSENFIYRKSKHLAMLRGEYHPNSHLQCAWNKYGEDAFEFRLLVRVPKQSLLFVEQLFLNEEQPEYNIAVMAGAPMRGRKMSEEAKGKIGLAGLGKGKFSEKDIHIIRELYYDKGYGLDSIADKYKVSRQTIGYIIANKTWKHIPWEFSFDAAQEKKTAFIKNRLSKTSKGNQYAKGYKYTEDQIKHKRDIMRGEKNPASKLSDLDRGLICYLRNNGYLYRELQQLFGMSRSQLYKIANGRIDETKSMD